MATLRSELLMRAIRAANDILAGYTESDLRSFTFDRMVDELYAQFLANEYRDIFPSISDSTETFWG